MRKSTTVVIDTICNQFRRIRNRCGYRTRVSCSDTSGHAESILFTPRRPKSSAYIISACPRTRQLIFIALTFGDSHLTAVLIKSSVDYNILRNAAFLYRAIRIPSYNCRVNRNLTFHIRAALRRRNFSAVVNFRCHPYGSEHYAFVKVRIPFSFSLLYGYTVGFSDYTLNLVGFDCIIRFGNRYSREQRLRDQTCCGPR